MRSWLVWLAGIAIGAYGFIAFVGGDLAALYLTAGGIALIIEGALVAEKPNA